MGRFDKLPAEKTGVNAILRLREFFPSSPSHCPVHTVAEHLSASCLAAVKIISNNTAKKIAFNPRLVILTAKESVG